MNCSLSLCLLKLVGLVSPPVPPFLVAQLTFPQGLMSTIIVMCGLPWGALFTFVLACVFRPPCSLQALRNAPSVGPLCNSDSLCICDYVDAGIFFQGMCMLSQKEIYALDGITTLISRKFCPECTAKHPCADSLSGHARCRLNLKKTIVRAC